MTGILSIMPPEIISKEFVRHFDTQTTINFAQTSTTALELITAAATFPYEYTDFKGERVSVPGKEDRTIKELLQRILTREILKSHPYFPVFIETARHSAKSDSLVDLISYARDQGNSDPTMLSLAFFDFETKKMGPRDLEKALKLAVQFPNNTKFIQAILSHGNALEIGGTTLGIVLAEVTKEDNPKVVRTVLSHPNAPDIRSVHLNGTVSTTSCPEYINWILSHPKTGRITGASLGPALIKAVKANHSKALLSILCHPNAYDIPDAFLKQALHIARKNDNLKILQPLLALLSYLTSNEQ